MKIEQRIRKYISPDENILALIRSAPFWGDIETYYIATETKIGILIHKGWFGWTYVATGWNDIVRVGVKESLFKCTVKIVTKLSNSENKEPIIEVIDNVDKNEARNFVSIVNDLIDENADTFAYRTKTCPQCDELVKWKAKVCKHCGSKL